jgi:predicted dehydrogenase
MVRSPHKNAINGPPTTFTGGISSRTTGDDLTVSQMNSQLDIAFLGVGHPHVFPRVQLLREMPDVAISGFYEPDAEIAERFARETGLARFDTADALLGTCPEIAIVNGLDPQVPGLAEQAAQAGVCGLLLEKPGAASPRRFFELARELIRHDIQVEIGYELHYADSMAACRDLIAEGVLGEITLARFHGGCPVGAGAELWQSIPEDPGGLVFTAGSHLLEIVVDLFGTPSRVGASVRRLPEGKPTPSIAYKADLFSAPSADFSVAVGTLPHEDVAAALLDYPDKIVTVDVTAWEPTYWCADWAVEIYGTNGALHAIPDPAEVRLTLRAGAGRHPAGTTVVRSPGPLPGQRTLVEAYRRQLASLIARVAGSAGTRGCDLRIGVGVMQIMQAIYQASKERQWVSLLPRGRDCAGRRSRMPPGPGRWRCCRSARLRSTARTCHLAPTSRWPPNWPTVYAPPLASSGCPPCRTGRCGRWPTSLAASAFATRS